ncbi:hypothetical protein P1X15_28005 [Runella sp. MFBS21]|uniref:hypothetical protein n=1 Tax=Runella sp. MFBS21 TaxID=3034018 RepID=UPI0023F834E9|nr:hypothetical protein [Runella sp. MFBS21]MDF7821495.1 hypothetical protein [Runella sp. MFBS21]
MKFIHFLKNYDIIFQDANYLIGLSVLYTSALFSHQSRFLLEAAFAIFNRPA